MDKQIHIDGDRQTVLDGYDVIDRYSDKYIIR